MRALPSKKISLRPPPADVLAISSIPRGDSNILLTAPRSGDLQSPTYQQPTQPQPQPLPSASAAIGHGGLGYLGVTSFSAVLQEAENGVTLTKDSPDYVQLGDNTQREVCHRLLSHKPSGFAIDILRGIPDRPTCNRLLDSINVPYDPWSRKVGRCLQDSLWETFGDILDGTRSEKDLRSLASKFCLNTAGPFNDKHTDPVSWFSAFSGDRFRWESLGILFAYWAIALLGDTGRFAKFGINLTDESRRAGLLHYKNKARDCAQLCGQACNGNVLTLLLLFQNSGIESNVSGDAGMNHWCLHGECVAMTTYLGLHASEKSIHDASISTQLSRRLFASVYTFDKTASTFSGRPPLISRRYSSTPLPLDMSDDELLAGPWTDWPRVDENGWNIDGKIYLVTILRARTLLAYSRDAILELSLQSGIPQCADLLLNLKQRENETYAGFPDALIYRATNMRITDSNQTIISAQLHLQVEHLQNLFFIERLLLETPSANMPQLVRISTEIVDLALVYWSNQNALESPHWETEWVIMCYGGPAAGILCKELLQPSEVSQGSEAVSKSTIVQQLSKLIGILELVQPVTPNAKLRANIRDVIRMVVDHASDWLPQTTVLPQHNAMEMMCDGINVNELFQFDLLNTFDWLRGVGGVGP